MRWLLTIAFVFFSWIIALSQDSIQFNHYTVEQGLSDNKINDIAQDDNGFIWLTTANGLSRFDGVQFKNFFRTTNNFDVPDNIINHIVKWKDPLLLLATKNGIGILNTKTGQCRTILIPSQKEISRHANSIQSLQITSKDEIIAGTSTGIYVFNNQFQLVAKKEAGYKPEDIGTKRFLFSWSLNVLSNGDVLAETINGMEFYDHQKKIFFPIINHTNPVFRQIGIHLSQHPKHIISVDRHDRFFCIDYHEPKNQVNVFDLISGKTTVSPFPTEELNWSSEIYFCNDTLFTLNATNGGFFLVSFDPVSYKVSLNPVKILPDYIGIKLIMDGDRRWWACTPNGVFSQSLIKQQFRNVDITNYFNNKKSLEGVMCIYRCKGKLYVGLESIYGGIIVLDENDQLYRKIDLSSLHPGCNMIWNIDEWNEDTLVIGTQSGLVLLNTNNYHFSRINYPGWPSAANEAPISVNYTDRHGTRWIGLGNTNGVLAFYPKTKTWKHFFPNEEPETFKLRYPAEIAEDKEGNLWMMLRESGLTRWNYQKQSFDTLIRRFDELGVDENDFNCMAIDGEGNLWMSFHNHGIIRWHPQKKQLQKFPFQNYRQNEDALALYTGVPGQLWIKFRQSLSVMNTRTGVVKTFTKNSGLPNYSATGLNFYYDAFTQNLALGFTNSFTRFKPRDIFRIGEEKKIFITEIKVLKGELQTDPQKTVKLKYSQNDLSIHFSTIDYENGHQNFYEYRLFENENSQWINIGQQQSINLNNLPPGKYIFQVRLSLPTANNNHAIAGTTIIIIPPFYRTWWFYLLCSIALAGAVYILYRMHIQQLIQVQQVRNRISSDLHDDIGARLTNIQILSALGEQKIEQPEQAGIYLHRIVNEVQTSGEALDDIVWSINPKNDSGEDLAARMRRYVAEVFETDHILCSMHVNDNISGIKLNMEKRRDLYMVFKEALNNILKHSQASVVNIELSVHDNKVMLQITDNGKGFDINQITNRNGLKNMKRRIQKWKGEHIVGSIPGKGTCLQVILPVNEPSLKRTILNWMSLH
jgi:ligand-binding sensor domain-containing protein/two-component sensor histidine kinase